MPRKRVVELPGFKAIGPYSQAVESAGMLFVSGQPGIDPSTGEAARATFEAQARRRLRTWKPSCTPEAVASIW